MRQRRPARDHADRQQRDRVDHRHEGRAERGDRAARAHRAHADPYDHPGLTDITAFVDFTAVAEAATAAGLALEGFTPQAHFLIGCGIEGIARPALESDDPRERLRVAEQVKQLTMPGQMGERFNAIGFSKGLGEPLGAFAVNDLSRRL